jgi:hypothetical protein
VQAMGVTELGRSDRERAGEIHHKTIGSIEKKASPPPGTARVVSRASKLTRQPRWLTARASK